MCYNSYWDTCYYSSMVQCAECAWDDLIYDYDLDICIPDVLCTEYFDASKYNKNLNAIIYLIQNCRM